VQLDEQAEALQLAGALSSFSHDARLFPKTMAPSMGSVTPAAFLKNSLRE
jgi:hypothetical protein